MAHKEGQKQIFQSKYIKVKNPNLPEANQLAIYNEHEWQRSETRNYREQIQLAGKRGNWLHELSGPLDLNSKRSKRTATLLPHFLKPVSFLSPRAHSFTALLFI